MPDYHFLIVYGVSGNARNRWDNANLRRLGYAPQDDAELHAARIASSRQRRGSARSAFSRRLRLPAWNSTAIRN